jgi:hypothetical protein
MRRTVLWGLALGFGVVVAWAAEEGPLSYARDVEPLVVKACGDCHGGDKPKKGLDLSKGTGYGHIVGVKSQEVPTMDLVKASDPAGSYLWLKVTHTATEGKGMPRTLFSAKKLSQDKLDLIQKWIAGGAQP